MTTYDRGYLDGSRKAWNDLLQLALQNLGYPAEWGWVSEREQAIAVLRSICAEHGDNDWGENLHLADIIDKHLGKHLEEGDRNPN